MLLSKVNILYSVLLCQEIIRNYRRKGISPRVVLKLDMAKAYDSLSCVLIENMLHALGFPNQFVHWIMQCVTSTKYSVLVSDSFL